MLKFLLKIMLWQYMRFADELEKTHIKITLFYI